MKPGTASATYGFGGRLTAEFPSQVIVDVTELCNLACTHCPHPAFKKSAHYAGRSLDPELNAKAVAEVAAHGAGRTQQIRYTGEGEPLLHQHLYEMVAEAVHGAGTFVSITINGTLLTEPRATRLLETSVGLVDISLDAFRPETYARIRVNGDLAVTRANVERLIALKQQAASRTRIVVSYIEQPENAAETGDFERFWRDAGADAVAIRRLHSASGAVIPVADLMRRRVESVARRPCVYPWERVVLNPRGMLCFCPADWTHSSTMVDYRTANIAETWRGAFYEGLRAAPRADDYSAHGFCGQCPDWQDTRWPDDGPSYASLIQRFSEVA